MTANWVANNYTVTFDGNGGSPSYGSKTVTYASNYGDLPTASRGEHLFMGWYTCASCNFDYRFYADTYADLKNAFGYNEGSLRNHWLTYGINEGRVSSSTSINTSSKVNTPNNHTLYAQWLYVGGGGGGGGGGGDDGGCSGGTGCWCGCCDSCAAEDCNSHGGTWDGGCH